MIEVFANFYIIIVVGAGALRNISLAKMAAGGSSMGTTVESPVLLHQSSDPEPGGGGIGFWQSLCCRVLKCGHVPRHIAFIMDGNRRFARKNQLKHSLGHVLGFDKLTEVRHASQLQCSLVPFMYCIG